MVCSQSNESACENTNQKINMNGQWNKTDHFLALDLVLAFDICLGPVGVLHMEIELSLRVSS